MVLISKAITDRIKCSTNRGECGCAPGSESRHKTDPQGAVLCSIVSNSFFFFRFIKTFFLKFKFIYFNWKLIALQYCIGFAIHQHESATGVHVFWTITRQALLLVGFSGKNTGMGCCALLQEIFLIQGLNSFSLLFSGIGRRVLYH